MRATRRTCRLGNDGQLKTGHEKPTHCVSTFHTEFEAKPTTRAEVFQIASIGFIPIWARDPRLPGLTLFFCEGRPRHGTDVYRHNNESAKTEELKVDSSRSSAMTAARRPRCLCFHAFS
jgi:hypothetical protein